MSGGAIQNGVYPNYLAEIGIGDGEARKRVEEAFETIFFDPAENFCHRTEEDAWCMVDTGNNDARTEGMSYGMMMCVQVGRKDIFDKLWTFADRYMRLREGPNAGYFAWSVQLDGKHNAEGPAPDGEEYFAISPSSMGLPSSSSVLWVTWLPVWPRMSVGFSDQAWSLKRRRSSRVRVRTRSL